ncbi:hypothetical protein HCR11_04820 [Wolbachia pipientis]|nr:hypothetical protein [Wolbachia pipientis]MBA8767169.1 hypothetical protein [Wolbachia pipientis]MDX5562007.1 hypothetical protein [Wolbachia endosymbiont of Andrena bicolor]
MLRDTANESRYDGSRRHDEKGATRMTPSWMETSVSYFHDKKRVLE